MTNSLLRLVRRATIETEYLPPLEIDHPFETGGEPPALLRALKPRITLEMAAGIDPIVVAPYGEPGPSKWPAVRGALLTGGALLLVLALRRLARGRR